MSEKGKLHRNDIYGDIENPKKNNPATPAATVVLLRDVEKGMQVLMLRKNSKIAFGGMWVFPGGRIDDEDYPPNKDLETAARTAAHREAAEEAGIDLSTEEFHWFAHWTPPASTPVRFSTWFFVAQTAQAHEVQIDDGEIKEFEWLDPMDALERHKKGEIDLAPPTWVTLYSLSRVSNSIEFLDRMRNQEPRFYETHIGVNQEGVRIAMWSGDTGYEDYDADALGARHRLVMHENGFEFLYSEGMY